MTASQDPAVLLVVEDDDDEFFLIARAFGKGDPCPDLRRACDGAEAINYLGGEGKFADRDVYPLPRLLLLDIKMPRMNGFDVLQWVRERESLKTMPVVMLTSSSEPEDIRRAYALGANSFVTKPSYDSFPQMTNSLRRYWLQWAEHPSGG